MDGNFVPKMRMILRWNAPRQYPIENKPGSETIVSSQRPLLLWQKMNILRKKKFDFRTVVIG
jgi:hypothetical protein